jgi:hypothetical protein
MSEQARLGYSKVLPPEMRAALEDRSWIDLEDFFRLADGVDLRVFVFATDALSGARSLFSTEYDLHSIHPGRFHAGRSFEQTGKLRDQPRGDDSEPSAAPALTDRVADRPIGQ